MASVGLRPLEDVARNAPAPIDRSAIDAGRHGRAEYAGQALLEGVQSRLALDRCGGELAPKDRRQGGVRDRRPVVGGVGGTRPGTEVLQPAGQAQIPGHAGHQGLVERDPRVPEHPRNHGRAEPGRQSHQVEREVEPCRGDIGAERGCGARNARTQAGEGRRTGHPESRRSGGNPAQPGKELPPRQAPGVGAFAFESGHVPPRFLRPRAMREDYATNDPSLQQGGRMRVRRSMPQGLPPHLEWVYGFSAGREPTAHSDARVPRSLSMPAT
jgi:hypothetical protein